MSAAARRLPPEADALSSSHVRTQRAVQLSRRRSRCTREHPIQSAPSGSFERITLEEMRGSTTAYVATEAMTRHVQRAASPSAPPAPPLEDLAPTVAAWRSELVACCRKLGVEVHSQV